MGQARRATILTRLRRCCAARLWLVKCRCVATCRLRLMFLNLRLPLKRSMRLNL